MYDRFIQVAELSIQFYKYEANISFYFIFFKPTQPKSGYSGKDAGSSAANGREASPALLLKITH